ncbi:MAG TPA: enoyl-CoA hydratase/isomerase family protein [Candidatus Binatia bacterium]|nr:enoyl-CoA hydratase/isomerase family protein [Candidatus Binatia bacterium]
MTESPVSYAARQGVAWLTLSRPAVLNALDTELAVTLAEHAERAAADPEVLLVVVRGAGRAFCSGMDRAALASGRIGEAFYRAWIRALNCLEDMPKVSLAVMHGYSIGGGLQLAVACDLRLAVTDAVIGLGATRHGLIPDGSVLRLARLIGLGRAKELTLLNDHLDAEQARAIGLVNWVCRPEAVEASIQAVADKVRAAAPTATAHAKRLLHESFHHDPRSLIEEVVRAQNECMASWEVAEANRAWQEKREAVYHPRPAGTGR